MSETSALHLVNALDEMEALDAALLEIGTRFVAHEIERGQMLARIEELRSLKADLRRKRARTILDAFLPPIIILEFELAGPRSEDQGQPSARAEDTRAA
jgi:hypothetical protein